MKNTETKLNKYENAFINSHKFLNNQVFGFTRDEVIEQLRIDKIGLWGYQNHIDNSFTDIYLSNDVSFFNLNEWKLPCFMHTESALILRNFVLSKLETKFGGDNINFTRMDVNYDSKEIITTGIVDGKSEITTPTRQGYENNRGGDRMGIVQYGKIYSRFLEHYIGKDILICEVGILGGIGLAVWNNLFPKSQIIGLDIDISNFLDRYDSFKEMGAFNDNLKVNSNISHIKNRRLNVFNFDQWGSYIYNQNLLKKLLGNDKKISIVIDDGDHQNVPNFKTFQAIKPYLADDFVYFIEDCGNNHWPMKNLNPRMSEEEIKFAESQGIQYGPGVYTGESRCRTLWMEIRQNYDDVELAYLDDRMIVIRKKDFWLNEDPRSKIMTYIADGKPRWDSFRGFMGVSA